jgi:hypothetical protein
MIRRERKRNDAEDIDGITVIDQPCPIISEISIAENTDDYAILQSDVRCRTILYEDDLMNHN